MSLYCMGKMTNRFGFSRSNGSSCASKSIVATVLIAENSFFLDSLSLLWCWSMLNLRNLFGDAPSTVGAEITLRGLYGGKYCTNKSIVIK